MMRHDKNLPPKMDIGYRVVELWTAEYDEDLHTQMGQFDTNRDRITVFITGNPFDDANTLMHEILHVIYEQYALHESKTLDTDKLMEERIVSHMADGLTEVYRRNPKVAQWITDKTNG